MKMLFLSIIMLSTLFAEENCTQILENKKNSGYIECFVKEVAKTQKKQIPMTINDVILLIDIKPVEKTIMYEYQVSTVEEKVLIEGLLSWEKEITQKLCEDKMRELFKNGYEINHSYYNLNNSKILEIKINEEQCQKLNKIEEYKDEKKYK